MTEKTIIALLNINYALLSRVEALTLMVEAMPNWRISQVEELYDILSKANSYNRSTALYNYIFKERG